ncbi:MAG: alcohol dehydrogenase catalytic domain-containing protein, partial [Roseiarcus sp.]
MKAMVFDGVGRSLSFREVAEPRPGAQEVLIKVHACAVCRTDLHIIDGDLTRPKLPLILGHEIAGEVAASGAAVARFKRGDRVGVPWLGFTCGVCAFCRSGRENLCDQARFTGYDIDGGFAQFTVADHRFCFPLPDFYTDVAAAPLLCAGLIGYRSLRLAGSGRRLGIYGFGAAAHIVAQVAIFEGWDIYAFTRPGDTDAQDFASDCGAAWTGGSLTPPPDALDAALIFAPVGALVPIALRALQKGGAVV